MPHLTEEELVAHYYTEAGLIAQAVGYWHKAGQRASERSAHVEALAHLRQGLGLLETLPETPQRLRRSERATFRERHGKFARPCRQVPRVPRSRGDGGFDANSVARVDRDDGSFGVRRIAGRRLH